MDTSSNSAPISAATLYEYDAIGQIVRSGQDLSSMGELDESDSATQDRITESSTAYVKGGSNGWRESTTFAYFDGSATPILQGIRREQLTALPAGVSRISESVGPYSNTTRTITEIDRTNREATTTIDAPDAANDEASVAINGLLPTSTDRFG